MECMDPALQKREFPKESAASLQGRGSRPGKALPENHGANDAANQQGNIVEDKGRYTGVPNMVVLTICIQTGRGPKVESEAGEPASPKAAAIPMSRMMEPVEKPSL